MRCLKAIGLHGYAKCELKTVPAGDVEKLVLDRLHDVFHTPAVIAQAYRQAVAANVEGVEAFTEQDVVRAFEQIDGLWANLFPAEQTRLARLLVKRVTVSVDEIKVEMQPDGLLAVAAEVSGEEGNQCRN